MKKERKYSFYEKPQSVGGRFSVWTAVFSVILFILAVLIAAEGSEQNTMAAGAITVMGFLLSIFSFFAGVRSFREPETKAGCGIAGTLSGGLVMLGYLMILFMGLK